MIVPLRSWWRIGENTVLDGERHYLVTGFAGDRASATSYPPHRREEWIPAEAALLLDGPAAEAEAAADGSSSSAPPLGFVSASLLKPLPVAKGISCFACKDGESPETDPFGNGWIFPPTSRTLEVGDVVSTTSTVIRRVRPAPVSSASESKSSSPDRSPRMSDGSKFEWVQAFGQHKGSGDWFVLCAYQRPVSSDEDKAPITDYTPRLPAWWVQELGAAEAAFMRIDTDRQGHVAVEMLSDLIGQLTAEGGADVGAASTIAEGFDADELEAAKRALDYDGSGIITRSRFCAFWGSDE
jgi:hypothetical protein